MDEAQDCTRTVAVLRAAVDNRPETCSSRPNRTQPIYGKTGRLDSQRIRSGASAAVDE